MYTHTHGHAQAQSCSYCGESKNIFAKEASVEKTDLNGYRFSPPFPEKKVELEQPITNEELTERLNDWQWF
jgi:hypothetical protein